MAPFFQCLMVGFVMNTWKMQTFWKIQLFDCGKFYDFNIFRNAICLFMNSNSNRSLFYIFCRLQITLHKLNKLTWMKVLKKLTTPLEKSLAILMSLLCYHRQIKLYVLHLKQSSKSCSISKINHKKKGPKV